MKKQLLIAALLVCALLLTLAGCNSGKPTDPQDITFLHMVVDENNISQLADYPNLKKVDLTGSTCYEAMAAYAAANPNVEVIYSVAVGSGSISTANPNVTLNDGTYEFDKLVDNLKYLPGLKSLTLKATRLNVVQMDALRQSYPNVDISCTIRLNGVELGPDTTELNLSSMTSEQVDIYASRLSLLPNLKRVELMTADGKCNLTEGEDRKSVV